MFRRLWLILGPIFCAAVIVLCLLALYPESKSHNLVAEKQAAASATSESFRERSFKAKAFSNTDMRFIPYFGSSELVRFDLAHPAVFAEKYQRSYRPYLLGQAGATSLNQFFGMQQVLPQLKNKQAVFIVSPQWFTKEGYDNSVFQEYFNSDQLTSFLKEQRGDQASQYAASRLLEKAPDIGLKGIVQKVSQGNPLTWLEQTMLDIQAHMNKKQSYLFGQFSFRGALKYKYHVEPYLDQLPEQLSYPEIEEAVRKDAASKTNNNEFGFDNAYYNHKIKDKLESFKNSQTSYNYLHSTEYKDFQLVLDQFAKLKMNVLFVIPPVNKKWMDYAGLSEDMYQKTVQKIRHQLESQGFTNVADFSKDGDKPYFLKDAIHMGWMGWVALDKVADTFLSTPQATPNYQLNPRFFSQDWADYDGPASDFHK